jgi:hypothetical protein
VSRKSLQTGLILCLIIGLTTFSLLRLFNYYRREQLPREALELLEKGDVDAFGRKVARHPGLIQEGLVMHILLPVKYSDETVRGALKAMFDSGMDVNWRNQAGCSLLHMVTVRRSPELVRYLLDSGANVNVQAEDGETPLHVAVAGADKKVVELLCGNGADPRLQDHIGRTPILQARMDGHEDIEQLLLETAQSTSP